MHKLAEERGGKCLSEEYVSIDKKLKWICLHDHKFDMAPNLIKDRGYWCPECGIKKRADSRRLGLNKAIEFALQMGWECQSKEYTRKKDKLDWVCSYGHKFKQSLDHAMRYRKCPRCFGYQKEEIVRFLLSQSLGRIFYKKKILVKGVENQLELDGYCEDLGIAFEYNGRQHYNVIDFFGGEEELKKRKRYDKAKAEYCKNNNIKLIVVKNIEQNASIESIPRQILKEFERLEITYVKSPMSVSLHNFKMPKNSLMKKVEDKLEKSHVIMLSQEYLGSFRKYKFYCLEYQVEFERTIQSLLRNKNTCLFCGSGRGGSIKYLEARAKREFSGAILSKDYKGMKAKYKWSCKCGRIFERSADKVFGRNSWCESSCKFRKYKKL